MSEKLQKLIDPKHVQFRNQKADLVLTRAMTEGGEEEKRYVEGMGLVFDRWTDLVPGRIRERISPDVLKDEELWRGDIQCCLNHERDFLLGRTGAGTMTIEMREDGVFYRSEIPPTSYGNDLIVHLERNNVYGSSFSFVPADGGYEIQRTEDGIIEVTHTAFKRLRDISPVYTPAYKQTNAQLSRMEKTLEEIEAAMLDHDIGHAYRTIQRCKFDIWQAQFDEFIY